MSKLCGLGRAQVLARKWQQKKDCKQRDVLSSRNATTEPSPRCLFRKQNNTGLEAVPVQIGSGVQTTAPRSWMPCCSIRARKAVSFGSSPVHRIFQIMSFKLNYASKTKLTTKKLFKILSANLTVTSGEAVRSPIKSIYVLQDLPLLARSNRLA